MKIDTLSEELLKQIEEANQLRSELKSYDHDCKIDVKGYCKWCAEIETANLYSLRKMARDLEEIKEDAEYEPPTPSNTQEAIEHFGVNFNEA